jgi:hypothetical protein
MQEKIKREHVGARVTKKAIENCEKISVSTGLSFSRVVEKAMELITTQDIVEIIMQQQGKVTFKKSK